jgi:hypothetical protein
MATQLMTNDYFGPSHTLQPHPHSKINGLYAAPSRESGLLWAIIPAPGVSGKVNICTTYNGQTKCLDIYNDGSSDRTRVCLTDPGYYSGQLWSLEPQDNGRCKLSNCWTGRGWYLDTSSDSQEAVMSKGDSSGHQWLMVMPSPGIGGSHPTQLATTGVPVPVYQDLGKIQESQYHGGAAGKIAGGMGATHVNHKLVS